MSASESERPKRSEPPDSSLSDEPSGTSATGSRFAPLHNPQTRFLIAFLVLLGAGFVALSVNFINDHLVVPFTAGVAKLSGFTLDLIGQDIEMRGTQILGSRFAVDIQNGCNGLETVIIFVSAVLAFPASPRAKGIGLALGVLAIQAVNLLRVVALYLTGVYLPRLFDSSHTVIWQTIVIAFGVLLWMFWANRFAIGQPQAKGKADAVA